MSTLKAVIRLSPCEQNVLILLVEKGWIKPVIEASASSLYTVRSRKKFIMQKLGETNTVSLVQTAIQKGLIP